MDPGSSPSSSQRAPFEVHSIHFSFPGSPAIGLKDPATDDYVSIAPEWTANPPRDEPAAYVRGVRPPLWVVFRGSPAADGTYTIGAAGALVEVDEGSVSLTFDAHSGLSAPIRFQAKSPLPDRIGRHSARFDWYVCDPVDRNVRLSAGSSSHTICTAWRAIGPDRRGRAGYTTGPTSRSWSGPASGRPDRTMRKAFAMRSSGTFADPVCNTASVGTMSGRYSSKKAACVRGGITPSSKWPTVKECSCIAAGSWWIGARCRTGKSSGARCYPERRTQPSTAGAPRRASSTTTIRRSPSSCRSALQRRRERRYRFWGHPGWYDDGHCINFLEYRGRLYLYDACFGTGPFEIDPPLPPDDLSVVGGADLTSFKVRYLDTAVDYMLGTLYNGTVLHQTIRRGLNGMTVKTALIPETVGGTAGLTFRWGP